MSNQGIISADQDWSKALSRRGFLKGAVLGGVGSVAMGALAPEAMAKAFLQGKTAADIRGIGVKPGIVDLDQNENPLGPSPMAVEAMRSRLNDINRYLNDFPIEMYMKLNMMAGVKFDDLNLESPTREAMREAQRRNRVMIAAGSTAILQAITLTALENGGHAIEAEGGYGDITRFVKTMQQRGRNVTLTRVPLNDKKLHDLQAIQKAVNSDTKLIVVTNPNNPTGTLLSHDELSMFLEKIPETVQVIIDEAYIDFVRDQAYNTAASFAVSRPNVIVARTFSKVYGLPGIRMGYALGHPKNFEGFQLYADRMMNTLSVHAANAALKDTEHIQKSKEVVWAGRDYLSKAFNEMGVSYTPSETNFMIVNVGKDPQEIVNFLRKNKVLVRNAHAMWDIKNHFRVSIGTMDELEVFVDTFKKAMKQA